MASLLLCSTSTAAAAAAAAPVAFFPSMLTTRGSRSRSRSRSRQAMASCRVSLASSSSSMCSSSSSSSSSSKSLATSARSIPGIGRAARCSSPSSSSSPFAEDHRRRRSVASLASMSSPSNSSPDVATPGQTKVAFLGMGIMGVAMASNLVKAGYEVIVWNRTSEACAPLVELGARRADTAAEAASAADVVVAMVSDPAAAIAVAEAAAPGLSSSKGYIDASTVDAGTAQQVCEIVGRSNASFLEAPVSGSKAPAIAGQLIFLTSGDASLSRFAAPLLDVMGKKTFYLGERVGLGAKMKLAVNALMGTMMASLAEQLSLARAAGLEPRDLLDVVSLGAVAAPMFALKGPAMAEAVSEKKRKEKRKDEKKKTKEDEEDEDDDEASRQRRFAPAFPLKHQRKDLRLALELAAECGAGPLPLTRAACEAFAVAQDEEGLGDLDFAAVVETVAARME